MAQKKPKVGDAALAYGNRLEITALNKVETADGTRVVAVLEDVEGKARRVKAYEKIQKLRKEMTAAEMNELLKLKQNAAEAQHSDLANQIKELNDEASEALFKLSLRVDLLSYWAARECWVSDGRVLSDDQRAYFRVKFNKGKAVDEMMHRAAYDRLDNDGLLDAKLEG